MPIKQFKRPGSASAAAMSAIFCVMLAISSSCAREDPNANLQRYDGTWQVLQTNGGTPLKQNAAASFAAPRIALFVSTNSILASGTLDPDGSFDATSVTQTLLACTDAEVALEFAILDLMRSHPRFTDNPDGTLTIEAAPYSMLLRRN